VEKDKNARISWMAHQLVTRLHAYTNLSQKTLISEALRLLADKYPELRSHMPRDYEDKL
jgi:hypothetical protein